MIKSADASSIIFQPGAWLIRNVVTPEANLIAIASAVAVFWTVEHRGSGVTAKNVDPLAADAYWHIPMRFGRQSQNLFRFLRVPAFAVFGFDFVQTVAWHIFPQKMLKGSHLIHL